MIARIHRGNFFKGAVQYCHRKSIAGPLGSSVPSEDPDGPNEREVVREFCRVTEAREAARPVVHIVIYIRNSESLSHEQWLLVTHQVRTEMGFEDCPWAAYLHDNQNGREGHRLHLLLSRVTFGGKVVSDWKDRYRIIKVMRDLELDLGLQQGAAQ